MKYNGLFSLFNLSTFILFFIADQLLPLAMYGSLPNTEQLKVFWKAPKNTRKIIVATNIAETSITVPNVVYGEKKKLLLF